MLFSRTVPLNNVYASGVNIKLVRRNDGDWDVEKLAGEEDHDLKGKIKRSLRWSILITNANIKDVKITLDDKVNKEAFNLWIPDIGCSINMLGLTDQIDINLKNADLYTSLKQLNIQGLSTKFIYTEDNTQIRGLKGNLNGIKIKFDGEIDDFIEPRFKFNASAYGIDIEKGVLNVEVEKAEGQYKSPEDIQAEFRLKIPDSEIMGKKIEGSIGKVKIAGTDIEVQKGWLKSEVGETSFNGSAKLDRILKKKGVNDFDFKIALKDIETSEILPLIERKIKITNTDLSVRLNANFDASGRWKEVEDMEAKVNLHNFELKGNKAGKLDLKGLIEASKSNVKLDVSSKLNKVNLALILGDEKYASDINSNLNIKGYIPLSGVLLDNLTASVQAEMLPSSAYGINFTEGKIDASYGGQTLDIRSFYLVTDSFKLKANGTRKEKGVDFNYDADIINLNLISRFFPEINLRGSLKSTGRVQGEIKKPRVTFSATASDLRYKDIEVKSTNLKGDVLVNLENPKIQFEGNLKEIKFQDRQIKSIDIRAKSDGKGLRGNLSILQDVKSNCQINLRLADLTAKEKNLDIEKIKLNLKDQVIENKDTINVKLLPNQLIVKSFNLYHEDNSVLGNADVVFDGNISADLELKKIDLSDISQILSLKTPMAGIVTGPINLKGTIEKPNLTANITIKDLGYGEFKSYDSKLDLSYSNKNLGLNLDLSDKTREILSAKGTVNVDFNLKNIGENIKKAVFDITINSNDFNLSSFANLNSGVQELTGIISGNANLKGTTVNPNIMANLSARDLSFREFKCDKVSFNTSYLNKQLDLNLDIQDKGRKILLAKGKADIDLDLSKIRENLDRASFDLTMKSDGIDLSPLATLNEEIKY
ncbi:MAG TPA: hypothetical protein VH878_00610, partial [Thermodesulfobacteriota bacterium]